MCGIDYVFFHGVSVVPIHCLSLSLDCPSWTWKGTASAMPNQTQLVNVRTRPPGSLTQTNVVSPKWTR